MASRQRILVVDDEPDIADMFAILLEHDGHVCECADTGARAIELVATFAPDVILLDIGLPDLDGYRVAEHVRATSGNTIFIAAVTGWTQQEDRERSRAAGIDLHVTKPIAHAELLDILARAARLRS